MACSGTNAKTAITIQLSLTNYAPGNPQYYQTVALNNLRRRRVAAQSFLSPAYPLILTDNGSYYVLTIGGQNNQPTTQFTELSLPYGCSAFQFNPAISVIQQKNRNLPASIPLIVQSSAGGISNFNISTTCPETYINLSKMGAVLTSSCGLSGNPPTTNHTVTMNRYSNGTTTIHLSQPQ